MQFIAVETANKYFKARLANDLATCLTFVSDDIEFESSRDGKFTGKDNFKGYLEKTPPNGTWDESATAEGETCVIRGKFWRSSSIWTF